ncbi:MAG TPA: hypothetical protein VF972_04540, partial [Actinomycetota bacterium]
ILAASRAHPGGDAPDGSGVVIGEPGAPARMTNRTYPATISAMHHQARAEVRWTISFVSVSPLIG